MKSIKALEKKAPRSKHSSTKGKPKNTRVNGKRMTATSVIDERTGQRRMLVRFSHTQGKRGIAVLDEALLVDRRQLTAVLRREGADLPKTGEELDQVIAHLIEVYKRTDKTLAVKPGFKNKTGFVLGAKRFGTAKGSYVSVLSHFDRQVGYLGASKGNVKTWNETVGAIVAHSSFGMFAVCAALCAPLSQYVKDRLESKAGNSNFVSETATFMFLGESSTGKTTLGSVATSTMGNKPVADWNVSSRGLEELAESHNNLLLVIDDAEKVDLEKASLKSALQRIAQSIPSGKSRTLATVAQKSGLPQLFYDTWGLATALDSSDAPFDQSGWKPSAGALARLIPIAIPTPSEGGIFDRLPPATPERSVRSEKLTHELDGAIAANFGTILPKWIKFLLKKDCAAKLLALQDEWVNEFVVVSDGVDSRLARKFGAVYAAGALAVEAKVLAWPVPDIKASVLTCYERALSYRVKLLSSWKDARQKLLSALADRTTFAREKNGRATLKAGMHGVRTKYKHKKVLAVRNNELVAICGSASKAHVINSLYADGLLIRGAGSSGTIQLPVRLKIGNEVIEKPRFWIFGRAALKKFE